MLLHILQVAASSHVLVLPPVGGDGNSVVVIVLVGALLHVRGSRRPQRQRATALLSPRSSSRH